MNPKVSVIIPVYKAEKTIEKCVRSLMEQTLEDIEYIFIDDCGGDRSMEIISEIVKEYPAREPQVKVIKMEHNSGTAEVRKRGVLAASGEYLIHCDSDDWVEPDAYQMMYERCKSDNLDMAISDYWLDADEWIRYWGQQFDGHDLIPVLMDNHLSASLWNKMVCTSICQSSNFVFPVESICEDFVFTLQYILRSKRVGFIDKGLYHYNWNPNSIVHDNSKEGTIERFRQIVINVQTGFDLLEKECLAEKYNSAIICQKYFTKKSLVGRIDDKDIFKLWKNTFREANWQIPFEKIISRRDRLQYILCRLRIYTFLKSIINK